MEYTVKMQNAIVRAAELAALLQVSDERADYEVVANEFVKLATGLTDSAAGFNAARSDFDYTLEQVR